MRIGGEVAASVAPSWTKRDLIQALIAGHLGEDGAEQVRIAHEPVRVLVMLVGADAVEAELGRQHQFVDRPVVDVGDFVGVAIFPPGRIDPGRREAPREILRQITIGHEMKHRDLHGPSLHVCDLVQPEINHHLGASLAGPCRSNLNRPRLHGPASSRPEDRLSGRGSFKALAQGRQGLRPSFHRQRQRRVNETGIFCPHSDDRERAWPLDQPRAQIEVRRSNRASYPHKTPQLQASGAHAI